MCAEAEVQMKRGHCVFGGSLTLNKVLVELYMDQPVSVCFLPLLIVFNLRSVSTVQLV